MSKPSNGSGSQTWARVGVLLALSSPLANLLKAWVSEGWSFDIMTEVLGVFLRVVTGSPSVSTRALPARAEFQVCVKCWDSNSIGDKGGCQGRIGVKLRWVPSTF